MELPLAQDAAAAAAKPVPVDTLLSMLNAAFSQFLSPEIVGKTILAAGRAAGLDDATLKAKLYAMGAVVKDEQQQGKAGKVKKVKGEGKGKGMSLYSLFLTKHCAETRAEDAKHPLAPGEKRDGNRLKEAIGAWAELDKPTFEGLYGDLVQELKARQKQGEKLDVAAEIAKFEAARGLAAGEYTKAVKPAAADAAKRQPDADAGGKPAKKPKVEESDEGSTSDDDDSSDEGANGKVNNDSSESDSDSDSDEKPAPAKATPSKAKKPAAAAPAKAAAAAKPKGKDAAKGKGEEGKKETKKKEKKDKKK